MIKKYERKFKDKIKEADDNEAKTLEAVKALIDMKDISNEDEQGKFIELLKGIVFADNAHGDIFLKKINDFTSGLKIEDFKESDKKVSKKKDMKEAITGINNIQSASEAITLGIQFIGNKFSPAKAANFSHLLAGAIYRGYDQLFLDNPEMNAENKSKVIKSSLVKTIKNVMDRI